jgi:putative flavoprotein involved in K+ transport
MNSLPGLPFPGPAGAFPTKDEMAAYLEKYKTQFDLPVLYGARVLSVTKISLGYEVSTADKTFFARNIVVATGGYTVAKIPAFANLLNAGIHQLHSSAYKSPADLPPGSVLVVGAGTSGLQIAMDLLLHHRKVFVAGHPPMRIPDLVIKYFSRQFVWFAAHVLNTGTPLGRRAASAIRSKAGKAPLINISMEDVLKEGAFPVARISGSENGWPVASSGERIPVPNIIWATGFTPDYSWIKVHGIADTYGYPLSDRGISRIAQGLYFVGALFQYGLTSSWIAGVGRDAAYVCNHIHARSKTSINLPVKRRSIHENHPNE